MQRPGGKKELGKFKGLRTIRMTRADGVRMQVGQDEAAKICRG